MKESIFGGNNLLRETIFEVTFFREDILFGGQSLGKSFIRVYAILGDYIF